MDNLIKKIDKLILFFIIYSLVFIVFFGTLGYTLPFVLSLLCALILQKPTKFLMKRFNLKNYIATLITTVIFFSIIISLLTWGAVSLTSETIQLVKNLQLYIYKNSINFYNLSDKLQVYFTNMDPAIVNSIKTNLSNSVSKIGTLTVTASSKILSLILNFLTYIPYIAMVIIFTLLSTYFFTKDLTSAKNKFMSIFPDNKTDRLSYIFSETKKMFGNYLLSYTLIIGITFIETLIVFLLLGVKYAVILSIICGIADLVPILGIGSIYIPTAIVYFLSKNYFVAFSLIICYMVVTIIRHIIEPKIVSSSLGIQPVAVLAAIFIGLKANGLSGMFFCIFLVVFYNIFTKVDIL